MNKEDIYFDKEGNVYVLDENGNHRPPMQTTNTYVNSGFTTYDTSHGHCTFCGSLTCNGYCFK